MKYIYPETILKVFENGRKAAERLKHTAMSPEHIILGIVVDPINRARTYMSHFGIKIDILEMRTVFFLTNRHAMGNPDDQQISEITLVDKDNEEHSCTFTVTSDLARMLKMSDLEARMLHNDEVSPEHLLLAMLKDKNSALSRIMAMYSVDYSKFKDYIERTLLSISAPDAEAPQKNRQNQSDILPTPPTSRRRDDEDEDNDDDEDEESADIFTSSPAGEVATMPTDSTTGTPTLDRFGYDLTAAAEEGLLDPVIGRTVEIEHMIQALLRRKKNNPILIGEPGVGKTAVVEGLAQRIATKQICWSLQNKRIISLDLAGLVAGTKFRGQFEKRITSIVAELRRNQDVIVFIDEIHTLVGAGSSTGSLDAANILKPALSRGEFQCIGSTTFDEYRNTIEKDGALERRFQKVTINPTSSEDTLTILHNIKDRYEQHHHVRYTDEALEMCVRLSERYVADRNFPDKAIDALDEAGARAHVKEDTYPAELDSLEKQLREAITLKKKAVEAQEFEEAARQREIQRSLEGQVSEVRKAWEQTHKNQPPTTVDAADIARVISSISGIPVEKAAASESDRLLELRSDINHSIIGQEEAVAKIVRAIQRSRIGLNDPNRPIGSFLFIGPTGVGKTLLARTIAREVFLDETGFIRLDMSEYSEQFAVTRLFGAPPGYIGHDKGGQLSEQVRRHPYSVILFDEIEKAHPNIYNVLLQILDDGQMTDSIGRQVNFKNTIIIMTSNVGSRKLNDFGTGIGFNNHTSEHIKQQTSSLMQKEVRKTFSPEFLNRIDDIIYFEHLDPDAIRRIVDLELDKVLNRIRSIGYHIDVDGTVRDFLATNGYDRDLGARPLRRAIQTYIEDEMCDALLRISKNGDNKAAYTIHVRMPEENSGSEAEVAKTTAASGKAKPCISVEPND